MLQMFFNSIASHERDRHFLWSGLECPRYTVLPSFRNAPQGNPRDIIYPLRGGFVSNFMRTERFERGKQPTQKVHWASIVRIIHAKIIREFDDASSDGNGKAPSSGKRFEVQTETNIQPDGRKNEYKLDKSVTASKFTWRTHRQPHTVGVSMTIILSLSPKVTRLDLRRILTSKFFKDTIWSK
jgi:hypothetical protein